MAKNPSVPTIDLSPFLTDRSADRVPEDLAPEERVPEDIVQAVASAAEHYGFFQVINHGIDEQLIERVWAQTRAFFARPIEEKRLLQRSKDNSRGYYDRELTKRKRDQKEVFDFTWPDKSVNQWPTVPVAFAPTMTEFYASFSELSALTLKLVYRALQFCEEATHGKVLSSAALPEGDPGGSNVRLNFYPTQDPVAAAERGNVNPLGDMALHHHTDPGMITLLLQDATGGLQTHSHSDGWIDVPPDPEAVAVNLGDCMQVWTNDAYRAAVHRVTPRTDRARFSTPYFFNPKSDAVIEPLAELSFAAPKYRAFTWREFIQARMDDNFADLGTEDTQIERYRIAA